LTIPMGTVLARVATREVTSGVVLSPDRIDAPY
jgi:hypothetical protein